MATDPFDPVNALKGLRESLGARRGIEGYNSASGGLEPAPAIYGRGQQGLKGAYAAAAGMKGSTDWRASLTPAESWIIQRESSFRPNADNPSSTAFGLGQLIASNRRSYGERLGYSPETVNPVEQLAMFREYVRERYGSPENAQQFWQRNGWY